MNDLNQAAAQPLAVYVKTTEDGRRVEIIDGWVCLAGVREANSLVPLIEHPNRQAIQRAVPGATHMAGRLPLTHAETAIAQGAMEVERRNFDASPSGITQRIRHAVWAKAHAEGIE
jgi:hypothetical protein